MDLNSQGSSIVTTDNACKTLADLLEGERAKGLIDVKFFLRNTDEVSVEDVSREVVELFGAMEHREYSVLNFNDLRWGGATSAT